MSPRGRLTPVSLLLPVCSWEIIDPGRASQSGPAPPPGDALRLLLQETSAFRQQSPGKVNGGVGEEPPEGAANLGLCPPPPSSACWSAACARSWPCWDATFPGWFCRTCWVRRRPSAQESVSCGGGASVLSSSSPPVSPVLGVFLWPLVSPHDLSLWLKPVLQKLDFGVGELLRKIKENHGNGGFGPQWEAKGAELETRVQ